MKAIPAHYINAICDTLIHSLWLGILLSVAAGLMVLCTRKASPQIRYNLLLTGLGLFAGSVLFIFLRQLLATEPSLSLTAAPPVSLPAFASTPINAKPGNWADITLLLRTHANAIVLIWLAIVLARTLQLLTGLQSLYFLRRRHITAISREWEERVKVLALQLGIKRMISIAESGLAKVPIVVGHLKPLILIPAGLITAMPPAGIEAMLIHELAHIRRRDYLVNLLVSSVEIVFFFNPAVLWVASLIREERENCCDDIALAHTGSKSAYINALVACHEYQLTAPAYAMAFSGRKDNLLGRVKRMLSNSNPSLNIIERAVLAVGLLTAVLFTAAFSNADKLQKLVAKVAHPAVIKADPITPVVSIRTAQANLRTSQTNLRTSKANLRTSRANIRTSQANLRTSKANIRTGEANLRTSQYNLQHQAYAATPYPVNYKPYNDDTNREKLTAALIADGVINKKEDLRSFKLSDKEFIVNDEKIPDEIYQKYRKAFVKSPEPGKKGSWSWMFNYDEKTTKINLPDSSLNLALAFNA
ncbi:M56 family metallopeptidase [Mucilaginibacter sp. UYCu711]|uniref:M56 family metallopeptidase n=1 Tax=Mucilaginibacter sp. UYCu711 TaxID=3156339 RepID=UPI003D1A6C2A